MDLEGPTPVRRPPGVAGFPAKFRARGRANRVGISRGRNLAALQRHVGRGNAHGCAQTHVRQEDGVSSFIGR
eukprot:scaffold285_cov330-Pavlova_lutheri.AAC.71